MQLIFIYLKPITMDISHVEFSIMICAEYIFVKINAWL